MPKQWWTIKGYVPSGGGFVGERLPQPAGKVLCVGKSAQSKFFKMQRGKIIRLFPKYVSRERAREEMKNLERAGVTE